MSLHKRTYRCMHSLSNMSELDLWIFDVHSFKIEKSRRMQITMLKIYCEIWIGHKKFKRWFIFLLFVGFVAFFLSSVSSWRKIFQVTLNTKVITRHIHPDKGLNRVSSGKILLTKAVTKDLIQQELACKFNYIVFYQ